MLIKSTLINRHFLVKEKVVAGGEICYFCLMLARQVLSQIMLAKTISQIVES